MAESGNNNDLGLMTLMEVAEALKVNKRTVDNMLRDGRLKAVQIKGLDRVYVRKTDLMELFIPYSPKGTGPISDSEAE